MTNASALYTTIKKPVPKTSKTSHGLAIDVFYVMIDMISKLGVSFSILYYKAYL